MNQEVSRERLNLVYWLERFKEHTIFIKQGLPCQRRELIEQTEKLQHKLKLLQNEAETKSRTPFNKDDNLLKESMMVTSELLDFKRELLAMIIQCQLQSNLYPLLIDHTAREAEEFMSLTTIYQENDFTFSQAILAEEIFWLRIMKDHSQFLCHLIDPSETNFIAKLRDSKQNFNNLYNQALDLESMLQANPCNFPAVSRFTDKVINNTRELHQFKEETKELLAECKLLSSTNPLFAEHTAKEAKHFLIIINQIKSYFKER
ncbi:DUF2935 domain-containing protein [Halanaerocella petrolearia]